MRVLRWALSLLAFPVLAAAGADGWITHPDAGNSTPIVLEFQRELRLTRVPAKWPVSITADNRFILFVNGERVASGPSAGTVKSWRFSSLNLAPHLKAGDNVITARVWNFGEIAPAFQQRVATGFRVAGEVIATDVPGWRVRIDAGHGAEDGKKHIPWQYYVASTPEVIDARQQPGAWVDAVPAPAAMERTLVADAFPPQTFAPVDAGRVVRSSLPGGEAFPAKPVEIPANSTAKLLLRRDAMVSAYPALEVRGGRDAVLKLQYGEALYDKDGRKGDRNLVEDRQMRGFHDTFISDGSRLVFAPLWWRTFRFVEIEVSTKSEPLVLAGLELHETGYPFEQVAYFRSDDEELNRIWDIGWRTLRVDAHETFMDSSYWEQLQYTGDTRLEMLITYAVSGDSRLARQAIEAFAESDVDGGLMQGAYPSRLQNVIATFAFAWVGMLADWYWEQPEEELVKKHLPRVRQVLDWFAPLVNEKGLLGKNPQWNFIDWAGQEWDDRDHFPSWGAGNSSCLMTAMWVGALHQGYYLESVRGNLAIAHGYQDKATRAREAIREYCWSEEKQLFADDADLQVFSQHMNVFAINYDIPTGPQKKQIFARITVPGGGIDAPKGMYQSSYYFAWYLARAQENAGLAARYFELLKSWRDLLPLNYTTWPESRDQPRSDSHAWSAHPTVDLLRTVAGISSGAPGYSYLRVAPNLGHLKKLEARVATPHGPVTVSYRIAGGTLRVEIARPAGLRGHFQWRGKMFELKKMRTTLNLPAGP